MNPFRLKVGMPTEFARYVVPKGFISVDGTSLTICDVHSDYDRDIHWFTFMLVGEQVNLEFDILAKMVERSMEAFTVKIESRLSKLEKLLGNPSNE